MQVGSVSIVGLQGVMACNGMDVIDTRHKTGPARVRGVKTSKTLPSRNFMLLFKNCRREGGWAADGGVCQLVFAISLLTGS